MPAAASCGSATTMASACTTRPPARAGCTACRTGQRHQRRQRDGAVAQRPAARCGSAAAPACAASIRRTAASGRRCCRAAIRRRTRCAMSTATGPARCGSPARRGCTRLDPASGASARSAMTRAIAASLADDSCGRCWKTAAATCGWARSTAWRCWTGARAFPPLPARPARPGSLSHNEVHYLHEDAQGTLWVGTASGLNRMQHRPAAPQVPPLPRQDGLADDAIAAILADRTGKLWLSSNTGVSSLDPASGRVNNYSGVDGTIEGAYFDGSALCRKGRHAVLRRLQRHHRVRSGRGPFEQHGAKGGDHRLPDLQPDGAPRRWRGPTAM
jgi:hypothetical protein